MSYDRMQQEIDDLMVQPDAADAVDDEQFGDRVGDKIRAELARP